jgi:hypothetical protein
MRRKEIFFKQLSFIFGIILIVSLVAGTEVLLPLRSEIKLSQSGGDYWQVINEIIIKQDSSNIIITNFSDFLHKPGPGIREGFIPIGNFKLFWDSLNSLNFWQLKEGYSGNSDYLGAWAGEISVSYETENNTKKIKVIKFAGPDGCPLEFKRIYDLFISMEIYAQFQPDLRDLLKYSEMTSERWGRFWYQGLVLEEISRIKDPKYLDTLLYLLQKDKKFIYGIIKAIGNIGDKKAAPVLYQFLEQIELMELPVEYHGRYYLSRDVLIYTTLNSLVSIDGIESTKQIKKYLDKKYDLSVRAQVSILLFKFKDYSGIPILTDYLKDHDLSSEFGLNLRQFCYRDKKVITAFIKALEEEKKTKELRIVGIIQTLSVLTDISFPSKAQDLSEAKIEKINKWITWWKENKDKFK